MVSPQWHSALASQVAALERNTLMDPLGTYFWYSHRQCSMFFSVTRLPGDHGLRTFKYGEEADQLLKRGKRSCNLAKAWSCRATRAWASRRLRASSELWELPWGKMSARPFLAPGPSLQ
jgi:hypothetical protein